MANQTVETMVEDLIGAIPDENSTAVTQWATDIAREVINLLPSEMLWQVSTTLGDSNNGSGATATLSFDSDNNITGVTLTAGGSNYSSDPTVVVNSSTGSGALIRAFSNGSAVIALDLVDAGVNYSSSDTVSIVESDGIAVSTAKFLYAHRNGYKAIEINAADKQRAVDSDSIYKATVNNPVFWREGGKVFVEPDGGSVVVVNYPTVNYSDASVTGVPDDVKHLVIMGAAVKGRLFQLDYLRRSIDNLTAPSYETTNATISLVPVPSITDLSVSAALPAMDIESPSINIGLVGTETIGDITVSFDDSPPSYEPPVLSLTADLNLSDLSISATPPVSLSSPSFTDISLDLSGIAIPEYTKPVMDRDFSGATTQITTNEDVELANAELDKISKQINSFQADIENELNRFNKESTEYQARVKKASEDAQLKQGKEFTEYGNKLQKYSADLSTYQQEVNREIQEYTVNRLQKDLSEWQIKRENDFKEYQLRMQNSLNEFNEDLTEYQTNFQKALKNVDLSISNAQQNAALERDRDKQNVINQYTKDLETYKLRLERYMADLQEYQADVSTEVQEYTINKIQKDIQLWQAEQAQRLQKYGADLQKESARYGSEFQKYQVDISNIFQKHQTMVQELQVLDAQYTRGLQTFIASYQEPDKNAKGA